MTDTQREAFEAAMEKHGRMRPFLRWPGDGRYTDDRIEWAWRGFKAAQAADAGREAREEIIRHELRHAIGMASQHNIHNSPLRELLAVSAAPADGRDDGLRTAVRAVVAMLKDGEYAEHWSDGRGSDAEALEVEITDLINAAHENVPAEGRQAFKREHGRYLVIKRKDLSDEQLRELVSLIDKHDMPTRQCVVVEEDWPEYEPVWSMIEARMTGRVALAEALFVGADDLPLRFLRCILKRIDRANAGGPAKFGTALERFKSDEPVRASEKVKELARDVLEKRRANAEGEKS